MVGLFVRAGKGLKEGVKTIKSVKPKLTKGESITVKLHKLKMAMKKGSDDASDAIRTGVDKLSKSVDKMKGPPR